LCTVGVVFGVFNWNADQTLGRTTDQGATMDAKKERGMRLCSRKHRPTLISKGNAGFICFVFPDAPGDLLVRFSGFVVALLGTFRMVQKNRIKKAGAVRRLLSFVDKT